MVVVDGILEDSMVSKFFPVAERLHSVMSNYSVGFGLARSNIFSIRPQSSAFRPCRPQEGRSGKSCQRGNTTRVRKIGEIKRHLVSVTGFETDHTSNQSSHMDEISGEEGFLSPGNKQTESRTIVGEVKRAKCQCSNSDSESRAISSSLTRISTPF